MRIVPHKMHGGKSACSVPHSIQRLELEVGLQIALQKTDTRPNPDMKTQSVYSFGRPSARSRMADA